MENCLKQAFFTQFWPHKKIANWYFAHILPIEGWNCQESVETKKTIGHRAYKEDMKEKSQWKCLQKSFLYTKIGYRNLLFTDIFALL